MADPATGADGIWRLSLPVLLDLCRQSYYISLDALIEDGLLTEEECEAADYGDNPDYINYEKIYNTRFALLRKAFAGADVDQDEKYQKFVATMLHG